MLPNRNQTSNSFNPSSEVSVMIMVGQISGTELIDSNCNVILLSYPTETKEPPANVTARPHSTTSIKVEWDPVPECQRNGNITIYIVKVFNSTWSEVQSAHVSDFFKVIEGLQANTNYSVQVIAVSAAGESRPSKYQNTTTHLPGSYGKIVSLQE